MKNIYIISNSSGWIIVSEMGEKLSEYFDTPNEALIMARIVARSLGAEIIIDSDFHAQQRTLGRNEESINIKSAA